MRCGHLIRFIMATEDYKKKLIELNKTYPLMKVGRIVVLQGTDRDRENIF